MNLKFEKNFKFKGELNLNFSEGRAASRVLVRSAHHESVTVLPLPAAGADYGNAGACGFLDDRTSSLDGQEVSSKMFSISNVAF